MTTNDPTRTIAEFLERFTAALGIATPVVVEDTADGPRLNLEGDEAEILVRHRGEPLKALQQVVDTVYGGRSPTRNGFSSMHWATGRAKTPSFARWPGSWPRK